MPRTAPKLGGGSAKTLDSVDEAIFEARFNMPLVHEIRARRAQRAPARDGFDAKTRGQVRPAAAPSRGARRGLAAARAGSTRARRSGPAAAPSSGPSRVSYTIKVNRKARRAALRSALSLHAERELARRVRRRDVFDAPADQAGV